MALAGGPMTAGASAASKPRTSVSVHFASPSNFSGRLRSPEASCVQHRVVHLQVRKGHKWVSVATEKTSRSGHFHGTVRGRGGGRYRAVAVAEGSCASGTSKTLTTAPATGGGPQQPCNLPLTHDSYDGFHIAVPNGWELLTLGGELEVEKDAVGSEAVIVTPAAQTSGLTAASYFQSRLSAFESQAASGGSAITVTGTGSKNGVPSATFTASIDGQTANGQASVLVKSLPGQASASELVFVADWAPSAAFAADSSLLSSVASCYGPETASLYRFYQDPAFTYMMPAGWSVVPGGEGPDNLNLVDGSSDIVSYLLTTSASLPFNSPQTLIDSFLNAANVTGVTKLWSRATGNTEYEEFTATFQGRPVHGLIYGEATDTSGFSTGVVRVGLAQAANWNAVNGALIQMAGAIQHDFTQDLETINQLNQQWQNFSNQVANFDDILNNQQLTQDPTTGIYYDAPYDSYEVDGPTGPGYYNGDQKLNTINRP
jgi:hypothetical protein